MTTFLAAKPTRVLTPPYSKHREKGDLCAWCLPYKLKELRIAHC
jgi:hypothetical protein